MSLFGALMGDLDEDPIFGHHMRSLGQMNNMMNTLMRDPFGSMMTPFDPFGGHSALTGSPGNPTRSTSLMPFGMSSMNRLLNGALMNGMNNGGAAYSSSSFVSMSHGPDGHPQIYQATSSTKTGPGGLKETRKTVQDSRTGLKKMAIGHHIGERAHIIEKEKNLHEGTEEERQDFINLEEEEAEEFDREFTNRVRQGAGRVTISSIDDGVNRVHRHPLGGRREMLALPAPPVLTHDSLSTSPSSSSCTTATATNSTNICNPSPKRQEPRQLQQHEQQTRNVPKVPPRRPLRTPSSSPLALSPNYSPTSRSVQHPHPYNNSARKNSRSKRASRKQERNS